MDDEINKENMNIYEDNLIKLQKSLNETGYERIAEVAEVINNNMKKLFNIK